MPRSRDLFDDTTMTFGEHLEALRMHVFKAAIGLAVTLAITLYWGDKCVDLIRRPIDEALKRNKLYNKEEVTGFWSQFNPWSHKLPEAQTPADLPPVETNKGDQSAIVVRVKPSDFLRVLHEADPAHYPAPQASADEKAVPLSLSANEFGDFRQTSEISTRPVTLNVQEAFVMYIKVAFVAGFILASPWIFYQMWQFVSAGLYPHERRYVHVYLPLSIGLFLTGVFFAFYLALPLVLDFLLSYNRWLGVAPQPRLSEWVSFVVLLPLMFGISFQLPLLMLFLERVGIFAVSDYRARRRLAIFGMVVAAMLLNPGGDVGTMILLFIPLVILYEFGILLCVRWRPTQEPAMG